jgi:hypothetical protein
MSKRIAPRLQELLREPVKGVPMLAAYNGRETVREVRALLAVARAADRLIVRRPGHFIVRDGIQYAKPLRDALDRLARASGPEGRR